MHFPVLPATTDHKETTASEALHKVLQVKGAQDIIENLITTMKPS